MPQIKWDQPGERWFETGVSKGVLYLPNGPAIPWNGLTGVDEKFEESSEPFYMDGIKYLDSQILGDFQATLRAFTYPSEFDTVNGMGDFGSGMFVDEQPPKPFGLSYQTRLGDDLDATDRGYLIHVLFGMIVSPSQAERSSIGEQISPLEFSWDISGITPRVGPIEDVPGFRPTAHIIIDSTELDSEMLSILETMLYGGEGPDEHAYLPSQEEFLQTATTFASIVIVDNGDGTWTATGDDRWIQMLSPTEFQIDNVDATYLDSDTFEVKTTFHFDP